MTIAISIGVNNFRFSLKKPCAIDDKTLLHVCLSFCLDGNFLPAAYSDNLSDTLDYEALCGHIARSITINSCASFLQLAEEIKQEILNFSPLISGGSISLAVHCHDAFTIDKELDIAKALPRSPKVGQ
jgi:dihydroneopterin aldolase